MLEVIGLSCLRSERRLLGDVSFKLAPGGLIWLKGSNGSSSGSPIWGSQHDLEESG